MVTALPPAPPIDSPQFEAITRDWAERAELIAGEIHVLPAPAFRHQAIVMRLLRAIGDWVAAGPGRGMLFASPIDVELTRRDRVQPDVAWWSLGVDLDVSPGPSPDLAVEVLSPGTRRRDVGVKRLAYESGGVAELWLVDPDDRSLTQLRRSASDSPRYDRIERRSGDDTLDTPLLPGLAVTVSRLFPV